MCNLDLALLPPGTTSARELISADEGKENTRCEGADEDTKDDAGFFHVFLDGITWLVCLGSVLGLPASCKLTLL